MEYRRLGTTDLNVSVVGLGGNVYGPPRLDEEQSRVNIAHALDRGINFIDTAFVYGKGESERLIGNALQGRRDQMIIATKFTLRDRAEGVSVHDHIISQAERSLEKLQTDVIDLYQIHQPAPEVPAEEILEPLAELVEQGKVRYIGECNYASWRHAESNAIAEKRGWPLMVSSQNHYNLLRRHVELEILPYCEQRDIAFLPYFPLAGGFLTGKYRPGQEAPAGTRGVGGAGIVGKMRNEENEARLLQLEAFAAERGHTVLDLAFAWLLAHPVIPSVIAGTSSIAQIDGNIAAAEWKLTAEERDEVEALVPWDGTGESVDGILPGQIGVRPAA